MIHCAGFDYWYVEQNKSPSTQIRGGDQNQMRLFARFLGADADGAFDVADENLAVADLAGVGGADDGLDGLLDRWRPAGRLRF